MNGVYSSETLMRDLAMLCMCERLEAALGDMVLIPTMLRSFYSHFTNNHVIGKVSKVLYLAQRQEAYLLRVAFRIERKENLRTFPPA